MTPEDSNKTRVLIVDDDRGTRMVLEAMVKKTVCPVEIEMATDGNLALRLTRRFRPHVIFLDYMLPRIDGLKVSRLIKGDTKLREARIILMTASASEAMESVASESGADCFFAKPLDVGKVRAKLQGFLSQFQQPV